MAATFVFAVAPAHSQEINVPPDSPVTHLQVWDANMEGLTNPNWVGFVDRMTQNAFAPDAITVQQIDVDEVSDLMSGIDAVFGPNRYEYVHSDSGKASFHGHNAVIYKTSRLNFEDKIQWRAEVGASCADLDKWHIGADFTDRLQPAPLVDKHVLIASVHFPGDLSESCIGQNAKRANDHLETLRSHRDLSIIAGDFNQKPDKGPDSGPDPEPAHHGLEADPDCWYRGFSAAHPDFTLEDPLGTCTARSNRYYDTVWLHPNGGGGTNPALPGICEQWTYAWFTQDKLEERVDNTSCTNLNDDFKLDNARIDYIWVSWETADGQALTPPLSTATPLVDFASVDIGVGTDTLTSYSDHRAVQALLKWPEIPPETP